MVRFQTSLLLPSILLVLMMLALPVTGSGCHTSRGELLAPWAVAAPPGELRDQFEAAQIVLIVTDLPETGTYSMGAFIQSRTCTMGLCYDLPDLRMAWYDANDTVLRIDADEWEGDQPGIPGDAEYGLLYFRTVPDPSTPVPYPLSVHAYVCG